MTQPNDQAGVNPTGPVAPPAGSFGAGPYGAGPFGGYPVSPPPYIPPPPQPRNGFGIAGLVLGIVALCFTFTFFLGPWVGGPLSILAIVFGAIGRGKANKGLATNRTMSVWGLSLGISACAIALAEVIIFIALAVSAGHSASDCSQAITNALNNPQSQSAQDAETAACS